MKSFTHLTYELSLIETLDAFQMGIGAYLKDSFEVRLLQMIKDLLMLKSYSPHSYNDKFIYYSMNYFLLFHQKTVTVVPKIAI